MRCSGSVEMYIYIYTHILYIYILYFLLYHGELLHQCFLHLEYMRPQPPTQESIDKESLEQGHPGGLLVAMAL